MCAIPPYPRKTGGRFKLWSPFGTSESPFTSGLSGAATASTMQPIRVRPAAPRRIPVPGSARNQRCCNPCCIVLTCVSKIRPLVEWLSHYVRLTNLMATAHHQQTPHAVVRSVMISQAINIIAGDILVLVWSRSVSRALTQGRLEVTLSRKRR